jgi:hypothetical protein
MPAAAAAAGYEKDKNLLSYIVRTERSDIDKENFSPCLICR